MNPFVALASHPLFVHVPVALVPLSALGVIAILIRRRWMPAYGLLVVAVSAVGAVGAVIAAHTGETLEESYEAAGQTVSTLLHDHGEMGEMAELLAAAFFVTTLAWVMTAWWARRRNTPAAARQPSAWLNTGLGAVAALLGIAATVVIVLAGHNGARSVWEQAIG